MYCYRIFNNYSIDTSLLQRICEILHRDFFKLYSNALESDEAEAVHNKLFLHLQNLVQKHL